MNRALVAGGPQMQPTTGPTVDGTPCHCNNTKSGTSKPGKKCVSKPIPSLNQLRRNFHISPPPLAVLKTRYTCEDLSISGDRLPFPITLRICEIGYSRTGGGKLKCYDISDETMIGIASARLPSAYDALQVLFDADDELTYDPNNVEVMVSIDRELIHTYKARGIGIGAIITVSGCVFFTSKFGTYIFMCTSDRPSAAQITIDIRSFKLDDVTPAKRLTSSELTVGALIPITVGILTDIFTTE